ncbi:Facilitated trehalose transporter Tret1 [Papilio machaon]|uniref:Facilitated trehalose transporter Tret1 n=1 Tax=Papilio machaon TaxID=76193 RepID=A0A0N1IHX2_PAPMA|nr:Facilitated trehalose transporter Tret1 [Papilio machaon]
MFAFDLHFAFLSFYDELQKSVFLNFPVFVYGASIGWMSPMTLLLQSKDSPKDVPLTESEVSWMAAAAYLVCIPADVLLAYAGDKLGRKLLILFISGVSAASWILLLVSIETWALVLSRALVGITMAGSYVTCPIYTKEISENHIRGTLGCLVILFHTTGNLFLYVIGDILSYRTILWVCLALPAFHIVLFMVMPESPSYLVKKGNDEEAARVLAWLRCRRVDDAKIQEELDVIKIEQKNDEESSKFLLKAIFKDKILFRAFRIALVATLAREVCGAIPVLNFAGEIFTWASEGKALILTPNQQAMLLGLVQVLGSALASSIVDRIGRRTLLTSTALISGLSMCSLASWFVAKHYGAYTPAWLPIVTLCLCIFCDSAGLQPVSVVLTGEIFSFKDPRTRTLGLVQVLGSALASSIVDRIGRRTLLTSTALISGLSMCSLASWFVAKHYGAYTPAWLPIVTLCLCIFCDSAGLQPVSVVLTGEIFSFKYRASVMGLTMGLASFADFIQMLFFKPLANSIGIHVAFYFFGGICLVTALYVTLAVPETKNRSLTEIYEDLRPKSDKDSNENKYDDDIHVGSFKSINIT